MPKQVVRLLNFTGGMQSSTSRFLQKDNEMSLAINVNGDKIGSINKRLGFKVCGASNNPVEDGKTPTVFYDGGTYLYTHYDGDIYYNNNASDPDAGTWTATTGGTAPTATKILDMQRFKDIKKLYVVGATANPTTGANFLVTQVIGNEVTTPGTKADAGITTFPRAKFCIRWLDRLYFAYCYTPDGWAGDSTAAINPARIVFSDVPAAGALTVPELNNAAFNNFLDADDPITGAMSTPSAAVFFTKYAMWKYDDNTWKKKYNVGCVSHKSIQSVDIYNFWLANEGIYVESGSKPQLISNKIKPIIDQIESPSTTFSWSDERKYYLYVGNLTLDGIDYQNCVIVYDVYTNSFYINKYRLKESAGTTEHIMKAAGSHDNGTNVRQYFGATNGDAFIFSHAGDSTKVYTDGDNANEKYPIEMKVQTKRYDFGLPEEDKSINTMTVFSEYAGGTKIKSRTDNKNWEPLGQIDEEIDTFSVNPANGKDVSLEFSELSSTEGPEINGISFNISQETVTND